MDRLSGTVSIWEAGVPPTLGPLHGAADGTEERFVADFAAHRYLDRIGEDMSSGARTGVNGTSIFFRVVSAIRHVIADVARNCAADTTT